MNLTDKQINYFRELFNVGVGRAAGILNSMLGSNIKLFDPSLEMTSPNNLIDKLGRTKFSMVQLNFHGVLSGTAAIIFPTESIPMFIDVLLGEKSNNTDLDEMKIGVLTEVGNIVLNGVMGTIGNIIKIHVNYSIPNYFEDSIDNILTMSISNPNMVVLVVEIAFHIEKLKIDGKIILIFEMSSFDKLLRAFDQLTGANHEQTKKH